MAEPRLKTPASESDHHQGLLSAPIVLVEYGDYECPYCGRADQVVKALQKTLRGDLCYVFRNFPLTQIHPHARIAAEAAEAAGLQDRFWEMHDTLFENQEALDPADLIGYATTLDLDIEKFVDDISSRFVDNKIVSDFNDGVRSGVNGTPGFFINNIRYNGDWSYEPFLRVLQNLKSQVS